MSLPVNLRPVARIEYLKASAWYEDEQPGLGEAFEIKVQATFDMIADQPNRFPIAESDIREAKVRRFPYCVYYRVLPDFIEVVGVFHQSRDPKEWQARS